MITKYASLLKNARAYYTTITISILLVLILIALFYSTIDIAPKKNITTIYYVDHISKAHQLVIDLFNKKYEGKIHVEAINLPFNTFSTNERKELLARYLRSKSDRIDIFAVDQIWVPRFAKWGINLEKYFPPKESRQYLGKALESCRYNDSLVAIPLYLDISLLMARKDLILQCKNGEKWLGELQNGITWERFTEFKKETRRSNPFYIFQADEYEGLMCILMEMVASANGSIIKNNSLYIRGNQALKKSIQQLTDLVNKDHAAPKDVLSFKENESFRYFISNNGMFVRAWPSFSGNDEKVFPGYNAVKPKLVYLPNPYFEGGKQVAIFGGWNLMISKNSRKTAESAAFLRFVVSPEAQKVLYENGLYLPVVESLYTDSAFTGKYPELDFFYKYIQHGAHRPFLKEYTRISDVLAHYVKEAISRQISVDQAIEETARKLESNILFPN
jgi:multiple sugar transport system substrate-binding protein